MKVYCRDCMYLKASSIFLDGRCSAPENVVDSFYAPAAEYKRGPREINGDNDCPWIKTSGPGIVKDIIYDASGNVVSYTKYEI